MLDFQSRLTAMASVECEFIHSLKGVPGPGLEHELHDLAASNRSLCESIKKIGDLTQNLTKENPALVFDAHSAQEQVNQALAATKAKEKEREALKLAMGNKGACGTGCCSGGITAGTYTNPQTEVADKKRTCEQSACGSSAACVSSSCCATTPKEGKKGLTIRRKSVPVSTDNDASSSVKANLPKPKGLPLRRHGQNPIQGSGGVSIKRAVKAAQDKESCSNSSPATTASMSISPTIEAKRGNMSDDDHSSLKSYGSNSEKTSPGAEKKKSRQPSQGGLSLKVQ